MSAVLKLAADGTAAPPVSPLERLSAFNGAVLGSSDRIDLLHTALNGAAAVVPLGHAFWVDTRPRPRIAGASATDGFDRHTPFAQWLEGQLQGWNRQHRLRLGHACTLESRRQSDAFTYPFVHAQWCPFAPDARRGGLLFTRDTPFSDAEAALLGRMAALCGTADAARRSRTRSRIGGGKRAWFWGSVVVLLAAAFIPVPLTALAPAEIVADRPVRVAAPVAGVIHRVHVEPGEAVSQGELIVELDATDARNELVLAEEALSVVQGRLRQAALSAFHDEAARRELAVAQAEADLAAARRDYAHERLTRTELRATTDGIALFTRRSDLEGQPVATGEAILRIAEPTRVLLRIHAPLAHGESLREGARVRFFRDSDPLTPIDASLLRADLEPREQADGHVAYEADARLDGASIRIGTRGVAKIYGETAPLGYFVLRRPLTLLRQWTGL